MSSKVYPSFVRRRPGEVDLWSPAISGDWAKDVAQGQSYAREIVTYMRRTGHATLLHHVVKAMVGHGTWGGVEVGFFQIVAMEAVGPNALKTALAVNFDYREDEPERSVAAT